MREKRGILFAQISRHNDWLMYIFMLAGSTAGFLWFAYIFVSPFFRKPLSSQDLVLLPCIAFTLLWYLLAVRIGMWRAFGIEQITIENGVFIWKRTALFWKRKLELPSGEIAAVETITPWHDLSNHVGIAARGKRYKVGDMLRRDETYELADLLMRATQPQK